MHYFASQGKKDKKKLPITLGFTLIELVISMGILSLLLIIMTDMFGIFLQAKLESQSNTALQQDGDFILARLFYDIARADDIVTPSFNGSSSATLNLVIDGQNYVYNQDNGVIQVTNTYGTSRLNNVGTTISNLMFTRIGNASQGKTVQFSFTETSTVQTAKGAESKNFSTTVSLRK